MNIDKSDLNDNLRAIASEIRNDYLSILVDEAARFNSGATGDITGLSFNIIYSWPSPPQTSYTSLKIDGAEYVFGTDGEMVEAPNNFVDSEGRTINRCICKYGDIYVTQYLEIVFNPYTNRNDNGAYIYTVYNSGSISHEVGLRIMLDTMVNNNDGIPFSITNEVGLITTERELLNTDDFFNTFSWYTLYSAATPDIGSQGDVLNQNYYGVTEYESPLPDRFVFCRWRIIYSSIWDYTIDPSASIEGDSAIAYWWNPRTLGPGEGFNCISHMGLNILSLENDIGLSGPETLEEENGLWIPNPFTIYWIILNSGTQTLTNVEAIINVESPGLAISNGISTTQSETITIPQILAGESIQGSISVNALNAGSWEYSLTALGNTISKIVEVPSISNDVDLKIIKTSTSEPISIGEELEYTITVTNLSHFDGINVSAVDTLPPNINLVSIALSQGTYTILGNVIKWNIGTLSAGSEVNAVIIIKPTKSGSITNSASVTADNIIPNPVNNNSTVTNQVVKKLSTGPIIKDAKARTLLISIENTTNYPVTIDVTLKAISCCQGNPPDNSFSPTIPANCTKTYFTRFIPTVYELVFDNIEDGIFIFTATRGEYPNVPLKCSNLICANRIIHSELIEL